MVVSQVTMAAPALKNTSSVAATSKQGELSTMICQQLDTRVSGLDTKWGLRGDLLGNRLAG